MGARTIGLGVAITACVALAGWRVSQWITPGRGIWRADAYPQSTLPLPRGTYALRLPPGTWRSRTLVAGLSAVRELPVRLVIPRENGGGDTVRYEALYLAPLSRSGSAHRTVVLVESRVGDGWKARAAALTREGQWCLVVALPSLEPPDDSLTMLLTAAARLAE